MDSFITIKRTKKKLENIFIGNTTAVNQLQNAIDNHKTVQLYGESGTGKSFLVKSLLKHFIEFSSDILRSKNSTLDFLDKLNQSNTNVVIDDLDYELIGTKEIVELVCNNKKISRGCFIIISKQPKFIDKCEIIKLEKLSINQLVTIGKKKFPNKSLPRIIELAKDSRGNVRNFLISLEFSHNKDIFKTPKQVIYDLVCSDVKYPETPSFCIGRKVQEHGYSWGIVHENYLDSQIIENCYDEIADWMSMADVLDTKIYEGHWELNDFFSLYGIIMPAMRLNHTLLTTDMRPGSSWTKYSNYKMRMSKYKSLSNRGGKKHHINLDTISLFQHYLLTGDVSKIIEYGLTSHDLDIINHLCIKNKLKPKNLLKLKNLLKNEYEKI